MRVVLGRSYHPEANVKPKDLASLSDLFFYSLSPNFRGIH